MMKCRKNQMPMTAARMMMSPSYPGDPLVRQIRHPWIAGWDTAQRVLIAVRHIQYDLITTAEAISAKQTE